MNIILLCTAILVLLYFALSLHVSLTRGRTKTGIGTGDDPDGPMSKAVRAHGNASEYVPLFVALFVYLLISGSGGWFIVTTVVIITVARILHALGMLMTRSFRANPHPLRGLGAMGTYFGGFALGVVLLLRALL
jgi:uncharacterized membrane protein YecN with MAPEG domain